MKSFRSNSRRFSKSNSIARISLIAAAALLALSPAAFGAADNWLNASGGSWTDSTWSMGSAPGPSNDAVFNLGSTSGYTVSLPSNQNVLNIDVDTDTLTLNLNGFGLTAGFSGVSTGYLNVGAASGQNASLTVTSSAAIPVLSPDQQAVIGGNGGTGSITIDHATVLANEGVPGYGFSVGVGLNSVGTLIAKDGAQIDTGISGSGPGGFGSFLVGDMGSGGSGSVSLNDSGAAAGVVADIGGNGSLTLTNKSTFGDGQGGSFFVFGTAAGGGLVSLDNSTLATSGTPVTVANGGTLTATDGAQILGGFGIVVGGSNAFQFKANTAVGTAKLTASGTGTIVQAIDLLDVGDNGSTGTVTFSAGAHLESGGSAYVGGNGGTGTVQLSGLGTAWTMPANPNPVAVIGANSSAQAGTGTVQLDTGATWTMPGTVTLDATGTLNVLSGATLFAKNLDLSHGGTTNFTGGTITLTGGTLTSSNFTLPNTSTLAGTGTLTGNLSSFGSVSPGDAPGILNVSGNFIQNLGGTLDIGLGGTTAGTQYDQLLITGTASLAGTLDVILLGSFQPAVGNSFDLFTDSGETGTFGTIILPALGSGSWDTSKLYSDGIISVVPEPVVTVPLLAVGLFFRRTRRRVDSSSVKSF